MAAIQPSKVVADKVVHLVEDQILTMRVLSPAIMELSDQAPCRSGTLADWLQFRRDGFLREKRSMSRNLYQPLAAQSTLATSNLKLIC
jgi:hypothetical protein